MAVFADLLSRERHRLGDAPTIEWQTVLLVCFLYGSWFVLTAHWGVWPSVVVVPMLAILVAWHGSLQHEVLHGHPTRWTGLNDLCGIVPLSLWIPYTRYKSLHLKHHHNERLTDPLDDPESYYLTPEQWQALSAPMRLLWRIDQTLLGRVTIGAPMHILMFWRNELRAMGRGDTRIVMAWVEHLAWCVPVVWWLHAECGIPLWLYMLVVMLPSKSLGSVRSFAEHRALDSVYERIAIVEGSAFFGPLFLYNNLHVLHHDEPLIPWFAYNSRYRERRDELLQLNGGLLYRTYFDVARRYLLTAHDTAVHPSGRAP